MLIQNNFINKNALINYSDVLPQKLTDDKQHQEFMNELLKCCLIESFSNLFDLRRTQRSSSQQRHENDAGLENV